MKKLIVMLLVLVMMASILVMPAMAAEIQPRHPIARCMRCGQEAEYAGTTSLGYRYYCNNCNYYFYIK